MSKELFDRLEGELEARDQAPGLQTSDLLALPEPERNILNWMIREGPVALSDVSVFLGQDESHTQKVLDDLRGKGYVRAIERRGVTLYQVRLAPKRSRTLSSNLWSALDDKV